ncbi:40S ribosomal protein S5-1 [Hordeum vulgare]|nr:40S ribosomal protein S5-1 [Hordeum vulgare]
MREGMLHIRDVEGPKKTGSVETRLEAMEQQVFKCHGMVERGLNANHMMITEFTSKHRIDANDIGKHLSRLYDRIDQLQGQIYDLQNQNWTTESVGVQDPPMPGSCVAIEGVAEVAASGAEDPAHPGSSCGNDGAGHGADPAESMLDPEPVG